MTEQRCLYAVLFAPRERIDDLLMEEIAPEVEAIRSAPDLDSLFFVRFSEPRWQLRFRVLGRPEWVDGVVRPRLSARVERLREAGAIDEAQFARYDREYERYGGPEGMRLAERFFFLDSLAALDLIAAERRGALARSRRELSILIVDRVLDLAGFDRSRRVAFYRHGYAWTTELDEWSADDRRTLEARFRALQPGLERLFYAEPRPDAVSLWGSEAAAAIAARFLADVSTVVAAVLEGHRNGTVRQDLTYLLWSYTHMFTNRLGIEAMGEAILRFFMHRLLEERKGPGA